MEPPNTREPPPRLFYEIAVASFAGIVLEIAYTRVFSFKFFYFFSYVVIAVGLLGLGAGGILVAVSRKLRETDPSVLVPRACFAGGASAYVGYAIVAPLQIDVSRLSIDATEILELTAACLLVMAPFLCIGVVVAKVLGARPDAAGALYGADLGAAALGAALAIPLLGAFDPPRTIVLAGIVLAAGGLRLAVRSRRLRAVGISTCVALSVPFATGRFLADPITDRYTGFEDFRNGDLVRFSAWDPVFRIDVAELPSSGGNALMVFHDGLPGSGLRRFGGDARELEPMRADPRALAFQVLPPRPRVLIIGSAGGHEVLTSILFGAEHVTGVELNPTTLSLLTHHFADFTGRLHERADVTFVNADARSFLENDDQRYDMIWFVAPDSYATMNAATASAFVLSESYLYTVEMLGECFRHLTENGIINAQFGEFDHHRKPNRSTRFLTTARAAFEENGVRRFADHVLLATGPGFPPQTDSVILLSRRPFESDQISRFTGYLPRIDGGVLRYAPGHPVDISAPNQVIVSKPHQLAARLAAYPWQVGPVRDDSPFFWHFATFRRALASDVHLDGRVVDTEDAVGEKVMLSLLAIVSGVAALLLLAPFFVIRATWAALPSKLPAGLYFAALGLGFMFIEISLMQRFTLLVGYPTYSLTITLGGLLVASGAGSLLTERYTARSGRALPVAFAVLVLLALFYAFALPAIIERCMGFSLPVRAAITLALLAPLGVCLGGFMPLGLRRIAALGDHPREYVAWAWAVNAFFSVFASVLATVVAMASGFRVVLLSAIGIYAVGVAAMMTVRERRGARD